MVEKAFRSIYANLGNNCTVLLGKIERPHTPAETSNPIFPIKKTREVVPPSNNEDTCEVFLVAFSYVEYDSYCVLFEVNIGDDVLFFTYNNFTSKENMKSVIVLEPIDCEQGCSAVKWFNNLVKNLLK